MRIIDTPAIKEIVTRRRIAGKGDSDNSSIVAEMVDDTLVRVSYDDPTTGYSSFTFPLAKVADVISILTTVKPPAAPVTPSPTTPAPTPGPGTPA